MLVYSKKSLSQGRNLQNGIKLGKSKMKIVLTEHFNEGRLANGHLLRVIAAQKIVLDRNVPVFSFVDVQDFQTLPFHTRYVQEIKNGPVLVNLVWSFIKLTEIHHQVVR